MDLPNPPPNPDGLGTPCGYTELRQVPWAPDDYVNPQGVDPTTFPRMPLPVAVPYQFPPIKAAPANLRPRHPDQETQLGLLDVDYQQEEHNDIRDMALLDANHMQENGSYGKKARTAAYAVLHEHSKLRLPYIHMSAERLQAATGMRNDHPFDLPNPAKPTLPPTFGPPITPPQNIAQNGAGSFIPTSNHLESESGGSRRDSGVALRHRLISNSPTDIEVNPVTGEGLRDWLLMMGKKHGIRKRECTSISLHDITPKPESGNWANVLLGHYGKGDRGERVDVYETDIPTTCINEETGTTQPTLETWVWFLISRPVLSISANDRSTRPNVNNFTSNWSESNFSSPNYPQYYSPVEGFYVEPGSSFKTNMAPAPNFPRPIPTSFVVFACPLSNLTHYDEITEGVAPTPPTTPFSRNNIPGTARPVDKKIHKRKDYDLSHQGLPLFEFGGSKFFGPNSNKQFLSVEALGPWYEGDPFSLMDPEKYRCFKNQWLDSIIEDDEFEYEELVDEGKKRYARKISDEPPTPFEGVWWERFYQGIYEDCERWRAVRRAMGLGKLRVVVRWAESQAAHPTHIDLTQDTEMAGTGFYGGAYGAIGGDRKGKGKVMPESYNTQRGRGRGEQRKPSNLSINYGDILIGIDGEESRAYMKSQMELPGKE